MPLDPNPELYPPYSGQSYVQIHEQNLKGLTIAGLTHVDTTPASPTYGQTVPTMGHYGQYIGVTQSANQKYVLYGRNPRFEIAQTIDAYKQNTEEFIASDTTLTAYLASRNTTSAGTIYTYLKSKAPNQDSNQQYVLGLSASMGGGQNTTYLATSLTVAQDMEMAKDSMTIANGLPVITPFESALISQAHASAVEAKNMGEIRDQQIRQTLVSSALTINSLNNTWADSATWDGTSIVVGAMAQHGAASTT
jgi:hypothetical protein